MSFGDFFIFLFYIDEVKFMHLDFFVVMSNLAGLFFLIAAGFLGVKLKLLKPEYVSTFSTLLMNITLPCTIFVSLVTREYDPKFIHDSLLIIFIGLICFPVMLYVSKFISKFFGVPKSSRGTWSFCCAFSNTGFMGFPICLNLFGPEGMALSVMHNIAFNVHIYTIGAIEMSRDGENKSTAHKINFKKIIFSSLNYATVLSLIFYFANIKVPTMILTPLKYLSDITVPMSMLIIGIILGRTSGKELLTDKNAYTSALLRLIIYPVIMSFVLKLFNFSNPLIAAVTIVVNSMPAASVTSVLANMYNGDIDLAAKVMFVHNILCMITIPAICAVLL